MRLLDLDLRACGFELLLDLFGFGLGRAFLDGLRSAFDEGLGFGEAETGDRGADFLDDVDLVRAGLLEDDVERGLLFRGCCSGSTATCGGCCGGHWGRGAHAPLGFELLHEISDFEDGESAELIDDGVDVCHDVSVFLAVSSPPEASDELRPAATSPTRNHVWFVFPSWTDALRQPVLLPPDMAAVGKRARNLVVVARIGKREF